MNFKEFCRSIGIDIDNLSASERARLEKLFSAFDIRNTQITKDSYTRAFQVAPKTFDKDSRSVEAVVLTDEPVLMYDWDHGLIREVLPMETARMPKVMPLLDTHNIYSCDTVLGSCTNLRVDGSEKRKNLVSDIVFARDDKSQDVMGKVQDGHIRDLSGGYRIFKAKYLEEGEEYALPANGRTYKGPIKIALDWEPYEGSLCPIGADVFAKIRSATPINQPKSKNGNTSAQGTARKSQEEPLMKFKTFCRKLGIDAEALTGVQRMALEALFEATCKDLAEDGEVGADVKARANSLIQMAQQETEQAAERAVELENKRQAEIRSICAIPGAEDLAADLINQRVSVEVAQRKVIEHLKATRQPIGTPKTEIVGGVDESEKFQRAVADGLVLRSGINIEAPAAGSNDFRGRSLMRIAEECLRRKNISTTSMSGEEIAIRAMTSSDFPIILANVANKALAAPHEIDEEAYWRDLVEITSGTDFKDMTVANFGGVPSFSEVLEDGRYKAVDFEEIGESYRMKTYGCEAKMTRQMIVNDSLGAFMKAITEFMPAMNKLLAVNVIGLITSNPTVKTLDGKTSKNFFSADHGNLITSANALGVDGMRDLRKNFRLMKRIGNKDAMNLSLTGILVPAELEEQARTLAENPQMVVDGVGVKNTSAGTKVVVSSRLDATSTTDYYGLTRRKPIQVAFLNGVQRPKVLRLNSRNPDNAEYLIRIDTGWGIVDHRYINKAQQAS